MNMLGIRTYDMTECARNNVNGSTKRWLDAAEANLFYHQGKGKKIWSKRDLEDLLWRYQVSMKQDSLPSLRADDGDVGRIEHASRAILRRTPRQLP